MKKFIVKNVFFATVFIFCLNMGCAKNPDGSYTMTVRTISDYLTGASNANAASLLTPPKEKQDPSLITQGRYKCPGRFKGEDPIYITIRKKNGGANAWVLTVPAGYRNENAKGKRTFIEEAEDFDCFQNGNRLICPNEGMKENWPDSKECMIVIQINANSIEVDPDRFPQLFSAGTQGGPRFPEGRCVKQ